MKKWCFVYGLKMFIGCLLLALLLSAAVMLLWNWLIPEIFHGPSINFLQAMGILALTRILAGFKTWGGGCGCNSSSQSIGQGHWKKKWEERLSRLTPEEREKIKEKYKKCCGSWDDKENQ